jgi:hypothetical protein
MVDFAVDSSGRNLSSDFQSDALWVWVLVYDPI